MKQSKIVFKAATTILASAMLLAFTLVSCAPITDADGDDGSGNEVMITIKLPQITPQSTRSLTSDEVTELRAATTSYRVTFKSNDKTIVRESASSETSFSASFYAGTDVGIIVECLNKDGQVIVRTVEKNVKIRYDNNTVTFKLSEDGTKIEPEPDPTPEPEPAPPEPPAPGPEPVPPPQPVTGRVTYNGNGADNGTPSDTQTYETGNEVTLQTGEPTRAGYTFEGWTSNVALEATDDSGNNEQIAQGIAFFSAAPTISGVKKVANFKMPEGGVVLTAKWMPIPYSIQFSPGSEGIGTYTGGAYPFNIETNSLNLPTPTSTTLTPPTGKVFDGWSLTDGGAKMTSPLQDIINAIKDGSGITISGIDIIVYAVWTPITYTIKLNTANSNWSGVTGTITGGQNTVQATYDTPKTLPTITNPSANYIFTGWIKTDGNTTADITKDSSGNYTVTNLSSIQNETVNLYPVWEDRPDLTSTPTVGSIIMKDGSIRTVDNIGSNADDAIAVVYKVDTNARKVWAVGKVLSSSGMEWATSSADGYNTNITALQESNNSDGSTGLAKLIAAASDAGTDLATNYPAWDYACNYGINQNLTSFQTGWYLPSKQELQEVYDNTAAIEAALAQTGVSKTSFGNTFYWSSSQYTSTDNYVYYLIFTDGSWSYYVKNFDGRVCAIRQFTW